MESFSPDELTSRAKQQQEETSTLAGEIVRWFIQEKHLGEMYQKENVIQRLSEYTSSPVDKARNGLQSVIGDIVDPVQQIVVDGDRYVGAIEYIEFEDSGAYGYIHFDDRLGKRKRVVCAKCVQEETLDENVVHATQGQGSSDIDATWDGLVNKVKAHYNRSHDSQPEEIYPGASLVSGTTIGGNTAFHQGNEGSIDAGASDHSELSGIGPNDHHSENHGNEDHNANYITDPGVTSVNGQTGSVSVSTGDLPWTFQETISRDANADNEFPISVAPPFQALLILRGLRPFNRSQGNSLELTIDGTDTGTLRPTHNDRLWGKVRIKEIAREFEGTLVESKTAQAVSSPSTSTVVSRDTWYPRGISSSITVTTPPDGNFEGLIDLYTR